MTMRAKYTVLLPAPLLERRSAQASPSCTSGDESRFPLHPVRDRCEYRAFWPDLRFWPLFCCCARASAAWAHEARPAYLEIKETAPGQFSVLWRTPVLAGMRLPIAPETA